MANCTSRVTTENGATEEIEDQIDCLATGDKVTTDVEDEDEVGREELENEVQWVGLETNSHDVLATSPENQPTMVPITTQESLKEHSSNERYREIIKTINQGSGGAFASSEEGLIVRGVKKEAQIVILEALGERVIYVAHYPVTSAHPVPEECTFHS